MKKKLKILMIEDSKDDAQLIIDYLRQGAYKIDYERVETIEQLESALNRTCWDVIYSDYFLSNFNGLDVLKLVKMKKVEIPFLLVSGKIDQEKAVEIIKAGADEYIMKDRLARLLPATKKLLQEFEMRKQFRKAEQRRKDSEKKFEIIFQKSLDVILIIDGITGKIINVNKTASRLLGYEKKSLMGKHFSILFPEEAEHSGDKLVDKVQTYGSIFEYQKFVCADGSICPMDLTATLLPWGKSKAILATLRDVRERVRVENELYLSEEKYQILVENANEAIVVAQNGMLKYANPKAADITGFSKQELLSKPFLELIHPQDQKLVAERYQNRISGKKQPQVYPFRIISKQGETKWVEISAVLINWEMKPATLNFLTDITERKQTELALKESEERYRKLVDMAQVGIAIHQMGKFVFVNKHTIKLLGYHKEKELVGTPVLDIVHPDSRQIAAKRIETMIKTGRLAPLTEEKLMMKDGSVIYGLISSIPVTYNGQQAFQVTAMDITELKHAEQALRESETKISKLNELFISLDVTPRKNIDLIVKKTCELLDAPCSLYNRLDDKEKSLFTWAGYNLPSDLQKKDNPEGHICYEATIKGKDKPVLLENLEGTIYEKIDPNVKKYNLKSYLGFPVIVNDKTIGSLCVVDIKKRKFSSSQIQIISTLAKALSLEEERRLVQDNLRASLKEKELLLKEIHHRVKNNLQVVSSLLYLQAKYLKDKEAMSMFIESQNRIRSMSLVHEKLYRSKNLAQIDFSGYIKDLVKSLFRSYSINVNRIKLKMNVRKAVLDIDTAIPCGLILNELVSNALKHAFPENSSGEIQVMFKSTGSGKFELSVSDNGIGLPDHFKIVEPSSLGMRLIETLVDQIRGKLEIEKNDGTVIKISFQKNEIEKKETNNVKA